MAIQTCTWDNVGGDYNWHNAANWATTVETDRVPLTGDSVVFNNTVNDNCLLTSNSAANMTDLTMTGYTGVLAMASNNLDFDGDVVLDGMITASVGAVLYCSGDFTKTTSMTTLPPGLTLELNGTGTVTCNSVAGGKLLINTAGTHTAADVGFWTSFELTAGTYNDGGNAHTFAGKIQRDAGTLTTIATWTMASPGGTLKQGSSSSKFFNLIIDTGAEATLSGTVWTKKIGGAGTITGNNTTNYVAISNPIANNFYTFSGTFNAKFQITLVTAATRTLDQGITLGDCDLEHRRGTTILGGNVILGTGDLLVHQGVAAGGLDMNGHDLSCNDIEIGSGNDATLDLGSGTHIITGGIAKAAGASGTLALDLATSSTTLTGTFNGTTITCTGPAAGSGAHPEIHGGTVQNVSMPLDDEALDCTDNVADGGSNVNCWMPGVGGVHGGPSSGEAA